MNMQYQARSQQPKYNGWQLAPPQKKGIPSGKHSYGKSPCLMGNFTLNGHVQ